MPHIGYNLHEYLSQMRFGLSRVRITKSSRSWSDPFLIRFLNIAWQQIAGKLEIHEQEDNSVSISSTDLFDIPSDCLGTRIRTVSVLDKDGKRSKPLGKRGIGYMREFYDLATTDASSQGAPQDWSISPSDPRKILLRPIPDYSIDNGLIFSYIFDPAPMQFDKVWRPDKIATVQTAIVTNGSPTVTTSGTFDIVPVVANADFGVLPTVNLDRGSIDNQNPDVYYRILSVAAPSTITLTEDFDGVTNTSASFLVAQVHPFELRYQGRFEYLAVDLAVADIIKGDNSAAGKELRIDALTRLEEIVPDETTGLEATGRRTGFHTNMLRD